MSVNVTEPDAFGGADQVVPTKPYGEPPPELRAQDERLFVEHDMDVVFGIAGTQHCAACGET